jgi:pimeloyl-ACP methyl ester carboxylesterase
MTLLIALHGIMTNQTTASWPDKLDAWMFENAPEVKVLKKEYAAGPFPLWNCCIKDPRLAESLTNEIELFLTVTPTGGEAAKKLTTNDQQLKTNIWLVGHSNGAVIALLTCKRLIERGYQVAGLILTGAACEADLQKNRILDWLTSGSLRCAVAFCSHDDQVLDGDPHVSPSLSSVASREGGCSHDDEVLDGDAGPRSNAPRSTLTRFREFIWGKLMFPYGCLGRTGWLLDGEPLTAGVTTMELGLRTILTRWVPGGHSTYFSPQNIENTFNQILWLISKH